MRPSTALNIYRNQIRTIVTTHHAKNARVFGSVISVEDTDSSDLDILIEPTEKTSLMDIGAIRHELKILLGVNVDVVTPNALPESFRKQVLNEAIIV
ncbi:DNA polymerase beta domain protein region [methanotrophic bacterial endosymbiont of Bathymodiolus sp.]|jgi:predicted nucleotidyltransferase|nr:DNA polymerase beta domain protein region [methanotrophic bacterial endosymbiont of Bathymodiolus sp.]